MSGTRILPLKRTLFVGDDDSWAHEAPQAQAAAGLKAYGGLELSRRSMAAIGHMGPVQVEMCYRRQMQFRFRKLL